MDVSIIIVNYHTKGLIKQQLKHFFSEKTSCTSEVIVVDNDSGDTIGDLLRSEFPSVKFIASDQNRGYGAGNNAGLRVAHGEFIFLCNPDIVLTATAVDQLRQYLVEHERVGMIGPKLINADGTLQYSCARFPDFSYPFARRSILGKTTWGQRWTSHFFMKEWDHVTPRDVDWLFGSCLMTRATAVKTVGNIDERFFMYLEDTDWCWRFWEKGFEVHYVPSVSLIHLHRRSSEGRALSVLYNSLSRIHLLSFLRYMWKYRGQQHPHST